MDSMRGMLSRAEGAGSSSRGARDGASEGSRLEGFLGDPSHVEGRARVSTRVRVTASEGGGDGDGIPLPPSVETAKRGRERISPKAPGSLEDENKRLHPKNRGGMTVRLGGLGRRLTPYTPTSQWGWGSAKGPGRGRLFGGPTGFTGCIYYPIT